MKDLILILLVACLINTGCSTGKQAADDPMHLGFLQYAMQTDPSAESRRQYMEALRTAIQSAESAQRRVPPGLHAELGYLQSRQGLTDQARANFRQERILYPEASYFLDRLTATQEGEASPASSPQIPVQRSGVVVILPPVVEESNTAEARDILLYSLRHPLIEAGYYVVPPSIVMDVLQSEGLLNTRLYMDGTMKGFREAFGADAVLIPEILEWEKKFAGEASELVIDLRAKLKSTISDQILWAGQGKVRADLLTSSLTGASVEDVLYQSRVLELSTIATNYWDYVGKANRRLLEDLPPGPYAGTP